MVTSLILNDDVFYIKKEDGAIFYCICIGTYDCEPGKYEGQWICGSALLCGPDCNKKVIVEIEE